jgi:carbamoyl-phosphate synthase large subunit
MSQKDKVKILITSAGSTNGVNVIKVLKEQKELKLFLIACDMNPLAAGFYMADKYFVAPKANSPNFIPTILKICKKERVQIIIPTFSYELPFFAKNKAIIEKEGIKMAISDYETFLITEDKLKTYEYFEKWKIPFPKVYSESEILEKKVKFPVIIRPISASGSKDVVKVNNWEELYFFKKYIKNSFVQEFVEGEEYTIDGINDLQGEMIAASPRIRLEIKGGLAVKSITVNSPEMVKFTKKIVEGFKIKGPFNVQCIKKGKEIKFTEVNSRFPSGGLPLTVKAGLNIPLILVKLLLGKKIKKPKIKPNVVMTRYWDAIILKKINKKYQAL